MVEPASVALKFGFLAVLYLFLLWVARSALKDLRRTTAPAAGFVPAPDQASPAPPGLYSATGRSDNNGRDPRLVVERAPGYQSGIEYEVGQGSILGRGDQ